uniref:Right handed beta helix domain-containing protein n=1 Tax=Tetradesmus obliquus TaxID=3088 RepID=A0A383W6K3_TETOB|eukprot:jgi/Sobl393_1/2571/SZX72316.1
MRILLLLTVSCSLLQVLQSQRPETEVQRWAAQAFPHHRLIEAGSTARASSIQAAVTAAQPAVVLLVLGSTAAKYQNGATTSRNSSSSASHVLLVDTAISVVGLESLVLTSAAALQQAAAATAGAAPPAALLPSQLFAVNCTTSKDGAFLRTKDTASVQLLGLAISGCPGTAVVINGSNELLLRDVELQQSNHKQQQSYGGALLVSNVKQVALHRVRCHGNFAPLNGGCMRASRVTSVMLTNSTFSSNWVSQLQESEGSRGGGGAVSIEQAGSVTAAGCSWVHNTALGFRALGGALELQNSGRVQLSECDFRNNSAGLEGGCISARDVASLEMHDSNFSANGVLPPQPDDDPESPALTENGAAVAVMGNKATNNHPVNLTVNGCRFTENKVYTDGGALYINQWGLAAGRVNISDSYFAHNEAGSEGGAVKVAQSHWSEVVISESTFESNTAVDYGGALGIADCDVVVTQCSLTDNRVEDGDGGALAVYTETAAGSGNRLQLVAVNLTGNSCGKGQGGAVSVDSQGLVMQDVKVYGNKALMGAGGVFAVSAAPVELQRVLIEDNSVAGTGAGGMGLLQAADVSMQYVTVTNNKGTEGGGLSLQMMTNASLSCLMLANNTATGAGGGLAVLQSGAVSIRDSLFQANAASLGGGIAADSSSLDFYNVTMETNMAAAAAAAAAAGASPLQFAAQVYAAGSAGGALLQRSSLTMSNSRIGPGNSAAFEAGGLLVSQPVTLDMHSSSVLGNTAMGGGGGGIVIRGAGVLGLTRFDRVEFSANQAVLDGGAVLLDSALGACSAAFGECVFKGNVAGQHGGSVAAAGPAEMVCSGCEAHNSSAGASGGWLSCTRCASVSISGSSSSSSSSSSSNCSAVQVGGVISCVQCGLLRMSDLSLTNNSAGSGGAVAAQACRNVDMSGGLFEHNAAGTQQQLDSVRSRKLMAYEAAGIAQWPGLWRGMYQAGWDATGSDCSSSDGSGGAVCLAAAGTATISDSTFRSNTAARGGAVAASVACTSSSSSSSSSSSMCVVQLANVWAHGNSARDAAGFLYTSTPGAIQVMDTNSSTNDQQQQQQQQQQALLDQLQQDNSVAEGGYGPGLASSPARLSLLSPLQQQRMPHNQAGDIGSELTISGLQGRRLLQSIEPQVLLEGGRGVRGDARRMLLPLLGSARSTGAGEADSSQAWVASQVEQLLGPQAAAAAAGAAGMQQMCPPLGATVLGPLHVAISSSQIFSLPLHLLDAFGAQVSKGTGSGWLVALAPDNSSSASQVGHILLAGASRGRLEAGHAVLRGLAITGAMESDVSMQLTASPLPGAPGQAVISNLVVRIRGCLPGETAVSSSSSSSSSGSCQACGAHLFSFDPYSNSASSSSSSSSDLETVGACQRCPEGGICMGGVLMPGQGYFQPHPRSSYVRACPHAAACTRDAEAMQLLQAIQCRNRQYLEPSAVEPRLYGLLQCREGYAGPLCACCYRPGRYTWLRQQQLQASDSAVGGYSVANASDLDLMRRQSMFDFSAHPYGQASGRCSRCPHIAAAWAAFLAARLLDMLLVALMTMLWLAFAWLAESPAAAAFQKLKQGKHKQLRFRHSLDSPRLLPHGFSEQLKDGKLSGLFSMKSMHSISFGRQRSGSCDPVLPSNSSFPASITSTRAGSGTSAGAAKPPSTAAAAAAAAATATAAAPAAPTAPAPPSPRSPQTHQTGHVSFAFPVPSPSTKPGSPAAHSPSSSGQLWQIGSLASPFSAAPLHSVQSNASVQSASHKPRSTLGSVRSLASVPFAAVRQISQLDVSSSGKDDAGGAAAAAAAVEQAAQLHVVVEYLVCQVQVVLDGTQIGALLLSLDLVLLLPDWAARGMAFALVTQMQTWQWVAFECLLPADSAASAAVVQTVLVLLLPGMYAAMLFPLLRCLWGKAESQLSSSSSSSQDTLPLQQQQQSGTSSDFSQSPFSRLPICENSTLSDQASSTDADSAALMLPPRSPKTAAAAAAAAACSATMQPATGSTGQSKQHTSRTIWQQLRNMLQPQPLQHTSTWRLLTATLVCCMGYCFCLYSTALVGAFTCIAVAGPPRVPGEVKLTQQQWLPDLQLQCWQGQHVAAAVVAAAVGLPVLLAYLWLLLVLAWPEAGSEAGEEGKGNAAAAASAQTQQQQQQQQLGGRAGRRRRGRQQPAGSSSKPASSCWLMLACKALSARLQKALLQPALQALEAAVRRCQTLANRVGVSGVECAGAGVWGVWWWMVVIQLIKFAIVVLVTATSMRWPRSQALVLLLAVVWVAALSWKVRPCSNTSMERMQFIMLCWLQLLMLGIVLLSVAGLNVAVYAAVLLVLVLLAAALVCFVLVGLVVSCWVGLRAMA